MTSQDISQQLAETIQEALATGTPLQIRGSGSKLFCGRTAVGRPLETAEHRGIVNYEPTELVLTARAGTPLAELDTVLAAEGQMMPFEPPRFGGGGTLGGAIACGLSGPGRPWRGAARDLVLGTRLINGRGEHMRFGGEVMKNVAGYDVSRLMAGAMGTLGLLTEVSVKVLPRPEAERTCCLDIPPTEAFRSVETWFRQGLPVTGAAHDGERLRVRLSGTGSAVTAGSRAIGGDTGADDSWWTALRDQELPWFGQGTSALWRVSLPPLAGPLDTNLPVLHDWNGQQLWLRGDPGAAWIRAQASALGGHAQCFSGGNRDEEVFHPPPAAIMALHRRLKQAFDPDGILNPGRLYADL